jgi:hypothetical protein
MPVNRWKTYARYLRDKAKIRVENEIRNKKSLAWAIIFMGWLFATWYGFNFILTTSLAFMALVFLEYAYGETW